MTRRLRIVGGALELAILGWVLACGQIEEAPVDGSGGASVSAGGTTAGGGSAEVASGGSTGGSGGGGVMVSPDTGGTTALDECNVPLGIFDPPCSSEDVIIDPGCSWDPELNVEYPASGLATPSADDLNLVLLPKYHTGGLGGADGEDSPPKVLQGIVITPFTAGTVTEAGFTLTSPATSLSGSMPRLDELEVDYLAVVENPESPAEPYNQGQIAVVDGSSIVEQKRLLIWPQYVCIVK